MALTVTTDLVQITAADSLTGWTQIGGTDDNETDYCAQGTACVSLSYNTGSERGSTFDIGAGATLNFSTTHAGKLIYIWMRCAVPSLIGTRASGAMKILLGSGATAPAAAAGVWSAWYVDGSDTYGATDGWKCYVIDPRKTPSTTFGGGVDLTAVRWFGGTMKTIAAVKGQPFGIDQIMYGFGELRARGTNTVEGAGFKEMSDADFGTIANRYGIITEKEGVFYVQGRLVLGSTTADQPLTFTSQNEVLVWNYPVYYDGTSETPCMNDARDDGTPYFGIDIVGNSGASGNTSVTFGAKVGTGDTAKGRSGPLFIGSRAPTRFDGDDGQVETVLIYGTTFSKFRAGIDLSGNAASDEFDGNTITESGSLQAGPVELRNCTFINNLGGTYKTFEDFINARASGAEALTTADPRYDWDATLNGSNLSIPSASAGYIELLDPGASDRREVVKIVADVVGNKEHYAEAIVRWPSGGASQGALGVCIRMATSTTENYYYLKADLLNSHVTLIRTDTGSDTTIAGPTSVTFLEDTDYLLSLRGDGTTIEGFVSGNSAVTKVSATGQSSYQTNRRVGIRGDAEADQTGDAPRLSRFGAGPETLSLGSVRLPATANDDMLNCSFINNARAVSVHDAETFDFSGHAFSGNIVGLRNRSGGTVTINVSGGDSPTPLENEEAGSTTIANTKNISVTTLDANNNPIEDAQVFIQKRYEDTDVGHPGNPFTSSTGNNRTDADFF